MREYNDDPMKKTVGAGSASDGAAAEDYNDDDGDGAMAL